MIRAVEPAAGPGRRHAEPPAHGARDGRRPGRPGKLCAALAITGDDLGADLLGSRRWSAPRRRRGAAAV
ncbi:MAG: hypothetical protein R2711_04040 [Acidimicrobiales bacterium]